MFFMNLKTFEFRFGSLKALESFTVESFLPSFLPSFLLACFPSFIPFFLRSFHPLFLPSFLLPFLPICLFILSNISFILQIDRLIHFHFTSFWSQIQASQEFLCKLFSIWCYSLGSFHKLRSFAHHFFMIESSSIQIVLKMFLFFHRQL